MGAVTPAGPAVGDLLEAVLAPRPTAAPIAGWDTEGWPVRFACEVTDADLEAVLGPKESRRTDRVTLLGVTAAAAALDQAGELGCDPARVAVIAGSGVGGLTTLEDQIGVRIARGPSRVSPFLVPMMMVNATAGVISMHWGFTGASLCVSTACASAANAIGEGMRMIRDGSADVVVAGGAEASITPTAMAAFARMGALSTRNDDPAAASRPFDVERDGFVMGEGAAMLVLERWDLAVARGAPILGELAGYGRTCDAHHITAPAPGGAGAVACMEQALADAGLAPSAIGHVNAHGTSTPLNDAAEAEALAKVFGPEGPPVTSTKGVTGHLVGAAGGIEAVIALSCATRGLVPPTANLDTPDPDLPVNVVRGEAIEIAPAPGLSNSFGFGGHNASLVVVPVEGAGT
ncbi:MAG: beta-ketoacyl-[acyl-carrier-protein] synthase family protein [Actinobacteria bacterium]|nr:beta-ketoacyl-[acyl-carrier-protein] synthase family protein [Actinomycetota bacterium]